MHIFFDLDSTIVTVEGFDELAGVKGMRDEVAKITEKTMSGEAKFEDVFPQKIRTLYPSRKDFESLCNLYINNLSPGIEDLFQELKKKKIDVGIITHNFDPVAFPIGKHLGISKKNIYSNKIKFNKNGSFKDFDTNQPLAKSNGKFITIQKIKKEMPEENIWFVGDSVGDMKSSEIADKFIGFGGAKVRKKVKEQAEYYIYNILDILDILDES